MDERIKAARERIRAAERELEEAVRTAHPVGSVVAYCKHGKATRYASVGLHGYGGRMFVSTETAEFWISPAHLR